MNSNNKTKSLTSALKRIGAENIEIKKNYHYKSGFFDYKGQLYYVSTSDDRLYRSGMGIVRTAINRKDFTGGQNIPLTNWLTCQGVELIR